MRVWQYYLFSVIMISCSVRKSGNNLYNLLIKNSEYNPTTFIQLDNYIDFEKLKPLDTAFLSALSKFNVLPNTGSKDWPVHLYYQSYFKMHSKRSGAIFAKSNYTESGRSDQLIMIFCDNRGRVLNAFIAAEITSQSECDYFMTTNIKDRNIIQSEKEDCFITTGQNEVLNRIDSTTYYYNLTNTGMLKLVKQTNIKIDR